ncbi:MAG: hypothetical protein C0478_14270 [Planctomyces sp.]|nr:hypothetical protein [Planctomyces sp.]
MPQPLLVRSRLFAAFSALCVLTELALFNPRTTAAAEVASSTSSSQSASPVQDDATLRAVCTVGKKHVFAVGDRGAVWISNDAGESWRFVEAQVPGSTRPIHLRCAQFVTDQIGWVGGHLAEPIRGSSSGVLLSTTDGGATWSELGAGQLPAVRHVQFFDLENAAVLVEAMGDVATGMMRTSDGGANWHRLSGERQGDWETAAWFGPEMGIVAGRDMKLSLVGDEQLLPSRMTGGGSRTLHGAAVTKEERGWLVGDGATILTSANGGVVWDAPSGSLPTPTRRLMDFRGVYAVGEHVWIAGSPGSVIWHSPDAGATWENQPTGETPPLEAIRFAYCPPEQLADAATGYAVGHLGIILKTVNSGKSWQAVHGGGRRAALTLLPSRAERVSTWALAKAGGEQGYRTSVVLMTSGLDRRASQNEGMLSLPTPGEDRRAAVLLAGGNSLEECWAFPLTTPGLQHNREALFKDWMLKTENKLPEMLLGQIVRHLRTWRPDVVVIDQPAPDDAVAQLMFAAMCRAVPLAADATRLLEQQEVLNLAPWSVSRVLLRLPDGSAGDAQLEAFEFLPRTGVSVKTAATRADDLLGILRSGTQQREAFRRLDPSQLIGGIGALPPVTAAAQQDLFSGLSIAPGSAARRALPPVDDAVLARRMKAAQKLRNVEALTGQQLGDPRIAGQMLAQVGPVLVDLSEPQGAAFLAQLARDYREQDNYELLEQIQLELIRRYPATPEGTTALRWLVQYWSSREMMFQRSRQEGSLTTRMTSNSQPVILRVGANGQELPDEEGRFTGLDRSPVIQAKAQGKIRAGQKDYLDEQTQGRLRQATELLTLLELQQPRLFRTPEVQLPLAALKRLRGSFSEADGVYRTLLIQQQVLGAEPGTTPSADPIQQIAAMEMWLTAASGAPPGTITICRQADGKPVLDGVLADDCWQAADDLRLLKPGVSTLEAAGEPGDFVMFSYDAEYLYLAGKCVRHAAHPASPVELSGRGYDAPLDGLDRVRISLDIDRDYLTAYHFEVSESGATRDACWERPSWNPQWFVAVDGDEEGWRFEAAIPWSELTDRPPTKNHVQAARAVRVIPAQEIHTWPAVKTPNSTQSHTIGLIKFD